METLISLYTVDTSWDIRACSIFCYGEALSVKLINFSSSPTSQKYNDAFLLLNSPYRHILTYFYLDFPLGLVSNSDVGKRVKIS
jgi:hypothetical protein